MPEWIPSTPANADIVSDFPVDSQGNILKPLKDAISREHTFPGVYNDTAGRHGNLEIKGADTTEWVLVEMRKLASTKPTSSYRWVIDHDNPNKFYLGGYTAAATLIGLMELTQFTKDVKLAGELVGKMNQIVSPGTRCFFVQAACPTGWTQVTGINDKMLRVVNNTGTDLGTGTGGDYDFDSIWNIMDISLNGGHDHAFSGTTAIPSASTTGRIYDDRYPDPNTPVTNSVHTHTYSGTSNADDPHGHQFISDGSWRPLYVDCVLANKDA